MLFNLANILVFSALAIGFLVTTLTVGRILRPQVREEEKAEIYDCGEKPITQAWFNFNPRFYIVALIFLIFDVEIAFTYPVGVVFRRWVVDGVGLFAFIELAMFMGILFFGLVYVWAKGDLEWLRLRKPQETPETVSASEKKHAA